MTRRVYCGKKTKIYVPKTTNPQIISYKPAVWNGNMDDNVSSVVKISEENRTKEQRDTF
jgi:hypothetical protein